MGACKMAQNESTPSLQEYIPHCNWLVDSLQSTFTRGAPTLGLLNFLLSVLFHRSMGLASF